MPSATASENPSFFAMYEPRSQRIFTRSRESACCVAATCSSFHMRCGSGVSVATCVSAKFRLSKPTFVQSVVFTSRFARISSAFKM